MPVMIVCEVCGCTYEYGVEGHTDICNRCMLYVEISATRNELVKAKIEVGRLKDKLRDLNNQLNPGATSGNR